MRVCGAGPTTSLPGCGPIPTSLLGLAAFGSGGGGGCCSEFGFFIWEDDNDVSRRVLVRINRKAGGTWLGQPAPHMVTEARCRFCCSGAPLRGTLLGSGEPVPTGAAGHRGAQLSDTVLFYFSSSTRVYRNFWQPGLLST